ncbi:hypothetical protein VTO42DRAFT_7714 [Malbranchea cinnamomea]
MEPVVHSNTCFDGISKGRLVIDFSSFISHCQMSQTDLATRLNHPDSSILSVEGTQNTLSDSQREKLNISKSAMIFLSSVLNVPTFVNGRGSEIRWDELLPDYLRFRKMKMEEPMLRSDHELDMRSFRELTSLDQMELDLPLEQLDNENDEGLVFPAYYRNLPEQMQSRTKKEKLDCPRNVLHFLRDIRHQLTSTTAEAHRSIYQRITWSRKIKNDLEPVTPPLLPQKLPPNLFIPPALSLKLEFGLEPQSHSTCPEYKNVQSLPAEDLGPENLNAEISVENSNRKFVADLPQVASTALLDPGGFASIKRALPDDLKVETPITPVSSKKRCLHRERRVLNDLLQDVSLPSLPVPPVEDEVFLDSELAQTAARAKEELKYRLEFDSIRGSQSSIRRSVPYLEGTGIIPPWFNDSELFSYPQSEIHSRLAQIRQNCGPTFTSQTQLKNEEGLPWNPFPGGVKKLDTRETFEGDNSVLEEFITRPGLAATEDDCNPIDWRFSSATLLNTEDETQDELLLQDFSLLLDSSGRRAYALVCRPDAANVHGPGHDLKGTLQRKDEHNTTVPAHMLNSVARSFDTESFSMPRCQFSAGKQLQNFMSIRGIESKNCLGQNCTQLGPSSPPEMNENEAISRFSASKERKLNTAHRAETLLLPVPEIPFTASPLNMVICYSLLRSHCYVVRSLENLSTPTVGLVFRDYALEPAQLADMALDSAMPAKSPWSTSSDLSRKGEYGEAHVVLSPTTGILLTTSQETTQLHLPGHRHNPATLGVRTNSPLRERILQIYLRYEQLYVLICHSTSSKSGGFTIDSKTADSVGSLASFCASLNRHCQITPLLIPSSTDAVKHWILNLSNKHRFTLPSWVDETRSPNGGLLNHEDPTAWERFLVYLGLNPFAAQAVLSLCPNKAPVVSVKHGLALAERKSWKESESLSTIGGRQCSRPQDALRTFLSMDPHERRQKFGPILGDRVLSRVERQLNVAW